MNEYTALRFLYQGRVQGVGFRMTAAGIAGRLGVAGFVRNLADGSVEAVACGSQENVQEFAEAVRTHYRGQITECATSAWNGPEEVAKFEIRY